MATRDMCLPGDKDVGCEGFGNETEVRAVHQDFYNGKLI